MSSLSWSTERNIENSLIEHIQAAITSQSLTVTDENGNEITPSVRVGFQFNDDWKLPVISLYADSRTAPRLSIGSNKRLNSYLLVLDIRALDIGMQQDLTDWVLATINDGFNYYEYEPSGDPDNPDKTLTGYGSIDFISNVPVRLGDTVDMIDKYRQNITFSVVLQG